MRVRFGNCVFDSDMRRLERSGGEVHLSPKAFDLLSTLIEARPRALSKEELSQRLWPDVVVLEANLPNLVAEIRRALGDAPRGSGAIRTVQRFGYAFSADAAEDRRDQSGEGQLVLFELRFGDREIPLRNGVHLLGRSLDSLVRFTTTRVSRRHAQIVVSGGRAVIEDLQSRYGTFVDNRRIEAPVDLRDGERIILAGELAGVFRVIPQPGPTTSAASPC